jgi:integrase/recombinase XerD
MEGYRTHLFYAEHKGRRLAFQTQSHRLSAVKGFTRFLFRQRYLLHDPGASVELPKVERGLPRSLLSETEVDLLLSTPDVTDVLGLRNRAMMEVFYSTAMRNAELRALQLDAVDLVEGQALIRRGKGGKGRVVPLGHSAIQWVQTYLQDSRPFLVRRADERTLFLSHRGGPLQKGPLAHIVRVLAEEAGLDKPVGPHTLRHACATHMLARGAGLRHLQELLGHSSPATTQRYTRVEISDLRRIHQRFHPREQDDSPRREPGGDA